jgi:quercetin 2,3-dioxygenase
MKYRILRSNERGHVQSGWLNARHSLSFGDYFNAEWTQFGQLRVFNHDLIAPASGFPSHPHRDMEIITVVLRGVIEHQDSMGNRRQIHAGQIQVMGAGTGVVHSEMNPSPDQELELFQIWILPKSKGLPPFYGEADIDSISQSDGWRLLVHPEQNGSIAIRQDASIALGEFKKEQNFGWTTPKQRPVWLQVISGSINIEEQELHSGDAIAMEDATRVNGDCLSDCRLLLLEI